MTSYWTSSAVDFDPSYSDVLYFESGKAEKKYSGARKVGRPVRAVAPSSTYVGVEGISVKPNSATVEAGSTVALTATVRPENATNKTVLWRSYDKGVATVSDEGIVTGVSAGRTDIEASTADGSYVTCSVTVHGLKANGHEYVDLGLPSGTMWATMNIGAENFGDYGDYYAWGETETKSKFSWSTYKWGSSSSSLTKYNNSKAYGTVDNISSLDLDDDAAHAAWGGEWRTPTPDEIQELIDQCDWIRTIPGRYGYMVISKINGRSIYLPFGGYYNENNLVADGTYGRYWSNSIYTSYAPNARCLDLDDSSHAPSHNERYFGRNIRPVFTVSDNYVANGVTFRMIPVEGGTFTMGVPIGEEYSWKGNHAHQVTLDSYSIGETPVTQELWEAVTGYRPVKDDTEWSALYGAAPDYPANYVSWNDCQEFIQKLNAITGETFRLPTEAEWEYAARGGNKSMGYIYSGSNNLDEVGWYKDNSDSYMYSVKRKKPNELGLYDMSGNVSEWCYDWYADDYYDNSPSSNPTGPSTGTYRVVRGGRSGGEAAECRVTYRTTGSPNIRYKAYTLRLAK